MSYRNSSLYISDEVVFYLRILAKVRTAGTEANMTTDNMADCMLRDKITTENPQLVLAWEKNQTIRQQSHDNCKKLEQETIESIRDCRLGTGSMEGKGS